jgi:hypothetical protein
MSGIETETDLWFREFPNQLHKGGSVPGMRAVIGYEIFQHKPYTNTPCHLIGSVHKVLRHFHAFLVLLNNIMLLTDVDNDHRTPYLRTALDRVTDEMHGPLGDRLVQVPDANIGEGSMNPVHLQSKTCHMGPQGGGTGLVGRQPPFLVLAQLDRAKPDSSYVLEAPNEIGSRIG